MQETYYIQNSDGAYYTGELYAGEPVANGDRYRALEMTDSEISVDFPKGLPTGWKKVPVKQTKSKE